MALCLYALISPPAWAGETEDADETVPGVAITVIFVSGTGASYEIAEEALAQHAPMINMCYEAELNAQPELSGSISFETFVAQGGFGSTTIAESTMNNPVVEHCVLNRLGRISFSDEDKHVWWAGRVIYKMHFAKRTMKVIDPEVVHEVHYFPAPTPLGESERRVAYPVSNAPKPLDPFAPPDDDEEED